MSLRVYRKKRDFSRTAEPSGRSRKTKGRARSFVIHEHFARRHHFDLRLELNGTLKSWALPKGPSTELHERRLAVHVEDHPLAYGSFEGTIPPGEYGAGRVRIWDSGVWAPSGAHGAREAFRLGRMSVELCGEKLKGFWSLVRIPPREGERQDTWLFTKTAHAVPQRGTRGRRT